MIGQFDQGRGNFFGIPTGFDCLEGNISKGAGHRFLALQKSIGMPVGRGRKYSVHVHEMSSASRQSRTENNELVECAVAELLHRGRGSAKTEEIRR